MDSILFWVTLGFLGLFVGAATFYQLYLHPWLILPIFLIYIWLIAGRSDPGDLLAGYPIFRWLSYILIPLFGICVAIRVWKSKRWVKNFIFAWIAVLGVLIILSGLVNHSSISDTVQSIAIYLRYPILFVLLVNAKISFKQYRRSLRFFLLIGLWLIFEAIFNYSIFKKSYDYTFFTIGITYGTANAGIFFLYGMIFFWTYGLVKKITPWHYIITALVFVAALIAQIRSVILLLFVFIGIILIIRYRFIGRRRTPVFAVVGIVLILFMIILPWKQWAASSRLVQEISPQYRFDTVVLAWDFLQNDNALLLGYGPRSMNPGTLDGTVGLMYQKFAVMVGKGYLQNITPPQLLNALSELGVIGSVLYWLMNLFVLIMALRFLSDNRSPKYDDSKEKMAWMVAAISMVAIWFHYAIFGLLYYDVWRMDITSLIYWSCAAAIYTEGACRGLWVKKSSRRPVLRPFIS